MRFPQVCLPEESAEPKYNNFGLQELQQVQARHPLQRRARAAAKRTARLLNQGPEVPALQAGGRDSAQPRACSAPSTPVGGAAQEDQTLRAKFPRQSRSRRRAISRPERRCGSG